LRGGIWEKLFKDISYQTQFFKKLILNRKSYKLFPLSKGEGAGG